MKWPRRPSKVVGRKLLGQLTVTCSCCDLRLMPAHMVEAQGEARSHVETTGHMVCVEWNTSMRYMPNTVKAY